MDNNDKASFNTPIHLSRNEYRLLVTMVYQNLFMHESLVNQQSSKLHESMNTLAEKLIRCAPDYNSQDFIAEDVLTNTIHPSSNFYETVLESINQYDEVSFWEELTQRLAERDVVREHGVKALELLDVEEYMTIVSDQLAYYAEHFSINGLDSIEIKKIS